jgi:hypothetical protein
LTVTGDAEINGLTVGRGSGNVSGNTASGYTALYSNTTGDKNTASGYRSLYSNTTGDDNAASGYAALYSNTTGNKNTALGYVALYSNTDGVNNTASGYQALYTNTTGVNNTALGMGALLNNTTGNNNAASGYLAGYDNTEGVQNTYVGYNTGRGITTGNYNTVLGANVTGLSATLSNNVIIADGQGNRRINIDGSGNVGVGTTAPTAKFVVAGGGAAIQGRISYDRRRMGVYTNTVNGSWAQSYSRTAGAWLDANWNALTHRYSTSGAERMRITSGGDVILSGTTMPTVGVTGFAWDNVQQIRPLREDGDWGADPSHFPQCHADLRLDYHQPDHHGIQHQLPTIAERKRGAHVGCLATHWKPQA